MTRLALLDRLKQLQQMPNFQKRDITTISALLNTEALAKHVQHCEDAINAQNRPVPHHGRSDGDGARSGGA